MSGHSGYEVVIGLEVHAQLATETKLFCGCATRFGDPPNVHTCEVCTAMPGSLPVLNDDAVDRAITLGLALGCQVHTTSIFARKHYFYLDLPKGYQITQFEHPLCTGGSLPVDGPLGRRDISIVRIHMEEDAGKNLHGGPDGSFDGSLVDLNRAGTPLVEVVSGPDMRSIEEAVSYLKSLHALVSELGVSEANMEQGHFRCDANVSVRPEGSSTFGTRVEIKNLNSFRFLARALEYEIDRQIELIQGGGAVRQETRGYDAASGVTRPQRGKEEAHDYRYFPEPDLGPLVIDPQRIEDLRGRVGELPWERPERLAQRWGLPMADAVILGGDRALSQYFEDAAGRVAEARVAANWILGEVLARLNKEGISITGAQVSPERLADLIALVEGGTLSGRSAKEVFDAMWTTGEAPEAIVDARGLTQVSDAGAIEALVDQVLAASPGEVEAYRGGKVKLMGFFVGQVMKLSRGRADPQAVNQALRARLGG